MNEVIPGIATIIIRDDGMRYRSIKRLAEELHVDRNAVGKILNRDSVFEFGGHKYYPFGSSNVTAEGQSVTLNFEDNRPAPEQTVDPDDEDYKDYLAAKEVKEIPFTVYDFKGTKHAAGKRYAIALFSDAHIEETVDPNSVLGLNEYNVDIAKKRIENYFTNLVDCLNEDNVEELVFASLGDTISGFIHDELAQGNGLTPLEATFEAQNLLFSGIDYICKNSKVTSFRFIGIVGNHSRTTKKIQHANGYKMSYEWLMYKNVEKECKLKGLPVDFCIPESELAVVEMCDGKKYIFSHGFQIRGSGTGTVCGIYPALNRLSMKWKQVFGQDKIYIGHFHQCTSIPNAVVNGSIIGYNSYSVSNGFAYEEPAQMFEVYDTEKGLLLTRKIYCK